MVVLKKKNKMVSKIYCDLCGKFINESIHNNNKKVTIGEGSIVQKVYENVCADCVRLIQNLKK